MSCLNRMYPGAMVLMVGLLPLASSQVHAQTSAASSLLSASIVTLPSATMNKDTDSDNEMLGDILLPDTDILGVQGVTTLSHAGSSSGWIIGGALGAAAGVAGLASSGGSSVATLLRTPSNLSGSGAIIDSGNVITTSGSTTTSVNGGITTSGAGGGFVSGFVPGGGVSASAVTPEPGSLALLGGISLMLTAVKLRRRKR